MLRQATPVQHVKFPILYALLEFSKGDENSSNMRGECCAHVGRMKNLSHVSFMGENLSLLSRLVLVLSPAALYVLFIAGGL